jgi:hypothetical protein
VIYHNEASAPPLDYYSSFPAPPDNNDNDFVAVIVDQQKSCHGTISKRCFNETVTLERNNESLFALYLGFFDQVNQNSGACDFSSSPLMCVLNGTSFSAEVLPLCSQYGGNSYSQNVTVNCTADSTTQQVLGSSTLLVTAVNVTSCAAASCNLTTFKKYNVDPTYQYSFASIAESAFQQYGLSNCQFAVVQNVQDTSSSDGSSSSQSGAHRLQGTFSMWMAIMLLCFSRKIIL